MLAENFVTDAILCHLIVHSFYSTRKGKAKMGDPLRKIGQLNVHWIQRDGTNTTDDLVRLRIPIDRDVFLLQSLDQMTLPIVNPSSGLTCTTNNLAHIPMAFKFHLCGVHGRLLLDYCFMSLQRKELKSLSTMFNLIEWMVTPDAKLLKQS